MNKQTIEKRQESHTKSEFTSKVNNQNKNNKVKY